MSGDSRGALALFRELRVEMPAAARSVEVLLESAETARDVDDAPAAEDLLREAEAAAPDDRRVYIGWLAHFTKGHRFDELAAFAVSRLDRPEFADLLVAAAAALAEQPRQADIAVRLAKLALRHDPANARAHLLIGNVEYARGRIEPAEAAFRAAIGSDPSAPAPLNNLAWLLARDLARYPEALALARDAVQRAPNEHTYRDTLAFALSALGNLEDARREYLACLNLLPPSAPQRGEVLLKVARIANRLKDKGPLRPWLQELRQLRGAPFSELTSEDRAALDELIASMGTSQ